MNKPDLDLDRPKASILVVDDYPETLQLLEQLLEEEGYIVRLIPDGTLALAAVRSNLPDLILLDIMMPEMDGYEVCRQLKAKKQTRDIPVIFISAMNESFDKMKAFSAGGVDYIIKPFNKDEALARISAHVNIRMLRKEVEENNKMLEQRVLERTAELAKSYEEKIQLQRQVQQSQKMEAIGTLAGGIAHDFNNILFSMYGYLELIIDKTPEESKTHDWTKNVLSGVKRATSLVDQILTFSRQTRKNVMPMNVQYILSEVLKLTCATLPARITICQNINKKCGSIMADPTQIHQIAMNLIVNAYHAMENSVGELTVKLGEIHLDQKKSAETGLNSGKYVCLTVEDTGIGMDGRTKARIFDPYFTTKKKGTGLGLSVIHGIVKNYGGGIDVQSEPGKGSKFKVYFPMIMEEKHVPKPEEIGPVSTGYENILLIDDEKEIVNMVLESLKKFGYQVSAHTSSLKALETFSADPGKFDLVITDLDMPNLTGIMLSQKMLEIRPDIPIILCTGFSEHMNEQSIKNIGIKAFVKKPIFRNSLAKIIKKVLDGE